MLMADAGVRACGVVAQPETPLGGLAAPAKRLPVARPRLFEVLASAQRVTYVSAPPGSGKSVLVRSWLAAADLEDRAAWVSVARAERDPQRWWLSVLDALRSTTSGSSWLRPLTPAPDLDSAAIVARLLEDVQSLAEPLWLVIDDLQELRASDTLEQLALLVASAPSTLRLVLLTRRDLRLGLHRLSVACELTEIRAADLRFSLEEAQELLRSADLQLSGTALATLVQRTEGWAAGLRLAALSLARHPDPERFAAEFSGSDRAVADYLLAEVLEREPEDVSRLLLRTSVLERVSGPLADHLTGGVGGGGILARLADEGAFVVALDGDGTWFRYHRLLADLLALELRRTAPQALPRLHAAAARWLAEHGQLLPAIRHAQAAEDWRLAASLLADHWFTLYLDGRGTTARELLAGFPAGAAADDPELAALMAGGELAGGSLAAAERYLALAADGMPQVAEERRGRLAVTLGIFRLVLGRARNDLPAVVEEAQQLTRSAEGPGPVALALDDELRALALSSLGIAETWTGQVAEAERHLEQALELAELTRRPVIQVATLTHLAFLGGLGSVALAEERSRRAIQLAEDHGWDQEPTAGGAYTVLSVVLLWRGRLEEGERWLQRAEASARPQSDPVSGLLLRSTRGLLELARGRPEQAVTALRAAERMEEMLVSEHTLATRVQALLLIALVQTGELEQVERALASARRDLHQADEMRVVQAVLHLARDDPEAASEALEVVLDPSRADAQDVRWTVQASLLEAIARDHLRDAGATARALEHSLELAEPDGVLLPFVFFPAPELLERHSRLRGVHASLIAEIRDLLAGRAPRAGEKPAPLPEPLSESEIRVLRHLPTNLAASEIATELFVSVNTVYTHMRHVYAKLGVHRRSDAVERARELGLLAPSAPRR